MLEKKQSHKLTALCAFFAVMMLPGLAVQQSQAQKAAVAGAEGNASFHWQTRARERVAPLWGKTHGTLTIDDQGVGFRAGNGHARHWSFEEIRTAYLGPRRVVIETYLNRSLHRPGLRHYRFELSQELPPAIAAKLAARIGRPVQSDDPDASAPAMATIPVRHRGLMRGTNGELRFRKGGIDYVTSSKGDSRSWRWADIQTLSQPDPYHLFVFGYRDTYTFDLKAPLSRRLFDYATNEIYRDSEAGGQR
jgi:hypothetical protein